MNRLIHRVSQKLNYSFFKKCPIVVIAGKMKATKLWNEGNGFANCQNSTPVDLTNFDTRWNVSQYRNPLRLA